MPGETAFLELSGWAVEPMNCPDALGAMCPVLGAGPRLSVCCGGGGAPAIIM